MTNRICLLNEMWCRTIHRLRVSQWLLKTYKISKLLWDRFVSERSDSGTGGKGGRDVEEGKCETHTDDGGDIDEVGDIDGEYGRGEIGGTVTAYACQHCVATHL